LFAADAREGREVVRIAARERHNVLDGMSANGERVGEKRAVTAPGNGFGAHDGAAFRFGSPAWAGEFFEAANTRGEVGRLHVVGETAEAQIVPASVWRIGTRAAQAAEFA